MSRKYTKSKKYTKKKSIFKNHFFWYSILTVFLILFFYFFFIHSRVFQVTKINIVGEGFNTEEQLLEAINPHLQKKSLFFDTKSIFLINRRNIKESLLDNFLNIKEVEVTKIFTNKILVKIKDRIPVVVIDSEDKEYLIDKEGLVFKSRENDYDLPIISLEKISLNDKILSISLIKKIQEVNKRLEPDSFSFKKEDLIAHIGNTYFVFSCQKNITQQIEDLLLVLESKDIRIENLEYFDLSHEKIFYKEK
jgi:cell division septal protein FtsQ